MKQRVRNRKLINAIPVIVNPIYCLFGRVVQQSRFQRKDQFRFLLPLKMKKHMLNGPYWYAKVGCSLNKIKNKHLAQVASGAFAPAAAVWHGRVNLFFGVCLLRYVCTFVCDKETSRGLCWDVWHTVLFSSSAQKQSQFFSRLTVPFIYSGLFSLAEWSRGWL